LNVKRKQKLEMTQIISRKNSKRVKAYFVCSKNNKIFLKINTINKM
jgi:hypothetical protein